MGWTMKESVLVLQGQVISLFSEAPTVSRAHSLSCWMGSGGFYVGGKATRAWSMYCYDLECKKHYFH